MRAKKYEERSDPLQKFLDENVEESFNEYITKADFMRKLNQWLKENKFREMSEVVVGRKMKQKGFESIKKYFDWLHDGKGGEARIWASIKWKN